MRWTSTESFWQDHYASGGDSGSGSFGRLAEFKADVLNGFIADHGVASVLELGCGDGNQIALGQYPRYVGLDVAPTAIDQCIKRFAADPTKSFIRYDPERWSNRGAVTAELAMSLDVIFHLVEDETYERYMQHLFGAAENWVIVYASNTEAPHPEPYTRHHRFTDWIEANAPEWRQTGHVPNRYPYDAAAPFETSFADFWFFTRDD